MIGLMNMCFWPKFGLKTVLHYILHSMSYNIQLPLPGLVVTENPAISHILKNPE